MPAFLCTYLYTRRDCSIFTLVRLGTCCRLGRQRRTMTTIYRSKYSSDSNESLLSRRSRTRKFAFAKTILRNSASRNRITIPQTVRHSHIDSCAWKNVGPVDDKMAWGAKQFDQLHKNGDAGTAHATKLTTHIERSCAQCSHSQSSLRLFCLAGLHSGHTSNYESPSLSGNREVDCFCFHLVLSMIWPRVFVNTRLNFSPWTHICKGTDTYLFCWWRKLLPHYRNGPHTWSGTPLCSRMRFILHARIAPWVKHYADLRRRSHNPTSCF